MTNEALGYIIIAIIYRKITNYMLAENSRDHFLILKIRDQFLPFSIPLNKNLVKDLDSIELVSVLLCPRNFIVYKIVYK